MGAPVEQEFATGQGLQASGWQRSEALEFLWRSLAFELPGLVSTESKLCLYQVL